VVNVVNVNNVDKAWHSALSVLMSGSVSKGGIRHWSNFHIDHIFKIDHIKLIISTRNAMLYPN
jgi:hypothetical protein